MSREKPKKSKRIKHRQALNDYLALGPDRSLEKLYQWYKANVPQPPCSSIIKIWSTRYGWQARSAEHDERVAGGVSQKVEAAAVEGAWDRVKDLTAVAQKSIKKVLEGLEGDNMEARDAYAVAALANTAMACIKTAELLSGRATDRLDRIDVKTFAPEWLAERLKAHAQASPPTVATTSDEDEVPG
ncbi:MAG: hypothetical protein IH851_13380, partial [Armatimonadetes bacterium]|nr:hypothetical protein [Armatimonadota bacterium]